jgi:SAM-dependent methyltransferase
MAMTPLAPRTPRAPYSPFPNVAARNGLQATIEVPALVRALALPTGGRVLEIGCGRGVALPVLERLLRPALLVGLDIDASLVAIAARATNGRTAGAVHADAGRIPFEDGSFDIVIDFGTCYHVADPLAVMREVARVLAPGGLFVHETPVSQHLAHPVRSFARWLPWREVPSLRADRTAVLWSARRKQRAALPATPVMHPTIFDMALR